jgi:hypothetical protein
MGCTQVNRKTVRLSHHPLRVVRCDEGIGCQHQSHARLVREADSTSAGRYYREAHTRGQRSGHAIEPRGDSPPFRPTWWGQSIDCMQHWLHAGPVGGATCTSGGKQFQSRPKVAAGCQRTHCVYAPPEHQAHDSTTCLVECKPRVCRAHEQVLSK